MARVMAIFLDGYGETVGRSLMKAGVMPALSALEARAARYSLDHGTALRTGLAGEHFATGLSPESANRWAAVHFDPQTYATWQQGTSATPFPAALRARTVVLDPPYFDLAAAPNVRGMVNWGAHDPGVASISRPSTIQEEALTRFGPYPASRFIYGTPWNSPALAQEMGESLAQAVRTRTSLAEWLFAQRLPDWELALLTISEAHSVIEGLWHGIDPTHPLHGCESAPAARTAIHAVYSEIDACIASMQRLFPDAVLMVFSMHGMGPNRSDAASMVLLPELMHRRAFRQRLFDRQGEASESLQGHVPLAPDENWYEWVGRGFPASPPATTDRPPILTRLAQRLQPGPILAALRSRVPMARPRPQPTPRLPLHWMPAARYQPHWHTMPAFALPSYYDGRIRVNLSGRERHGLVPLASYRAFCAELAAELRRCSDPISGKPVVEHVEFAACADPRDLGETESDLILVWHGAPLGIVHPDHGQIGPIPYRRTGGHTGGYGFALVQGPGIPPGDHGLRSAHDVVPTLVSLLGEDPSPAFSGVSFVNPAAPSSRCGASPR